MKRTSYCWTFDHQTGSHHIWYSSKRVRISIQPTKNGEAKAYQVKQFLKIQEEENESNNRGF
ncbi:MULTISPECIES: type II toxin-antitoxin system HicA family toxin [unclassified Microcystis]|uniref:type II toxin-antitoxin system HicA family toxin n=1 Tax=unclassified Microcystis TaxID=2643300 RepID=UPI00338E8ED1